MIMNVYNEADMLEYLAEVLPYIDELVVAEGSPIGPSVDSTVETLEEVADRHGVALTLLRDTYRREEDSGYDSARMRNSMLEATTGDFILYHHADVVYGEGCFALLREAVDTFPHMDIFYSPLTEFFFDMRHVLLHVPVREEHPRRLCGDALVYKAGIGLAFVQKPLTGLVINKPFRPIGVPGSVKSLLLPDVKRYHLCFVRQFSHQVEKHVRRITQRDWGEAGEPILQAGYETVFDTALKHVEDYPKALGMFSYCGSYPSVLEGRRLSAFDGKGEFYKNLESYKQRFAAYYNPSVYEAAKYVPWQEQVEVKP
jgi:hypothetical protein